MRTKTRVRLVQVRMTEEEFGRFTKQVKNSGMNRSTYARNVLNGSEPPDRNVPYLISEVRNAGEALRQILELTEQTLPEHSDEIRQALERNRQAEKLIFSAYGGITCH
ncbi:MAG: hypothetical protein J5744_07620 [Oscillospiraceae bacterium]|nr:hypothetical protein [Oscillospiraceae bacterium]